MKITRYWSQSTLYGGCHKKISLVHEGWKLTLEPNYMALGTALHRYAALRSQGVDFLKAEESAMACISGPNIKKVIPWIGFHTVLGVCSAWESSPERYLPVTRIINGESKPCVEMSLAVPLAENDQFMDIATGTIDALTQSPAGYICIDDYKVTTKWEVDLSEYEMSTQFVHYPWIIRRFAQMFPASQIATEIFPKLSHIRINSIKVTNRKDDYATLDSHEFKIDWHRVDAYGDMLLNFVTNQFTPNLQTGLLHNSCMSGKDYKCDFYEICNFKRYENFIQVPYNPLASQAESRVNSPGVYQPL